MEGKKKINFALLIIKKIFYIAYAKSSELIAQAVSTAVFRADVLLLPSYEAFTGFP